MTIFNLSFRTEEQRDKVEELLKREVYWMKNIATGHSGTIHDLTPIASEYSIDLMIDDEFSSSISQKLTTLGLEYTISKIEGTMSA